MNLKPNHLEDEDDAFLVFAVVYRDLVEEGVCFVVVFLQYTMHLISTHHIKYAKPQ